MRPASLASIYILDWLVGDPEQLPHPVRVIGGAARYVEKIIRPLGKGRWYELASGGAITVVLTMGAGWAARRSIAFAKRRAGMWGSILEIWLGSTCLATRNLIDEAQAVVAALERGDVPSARRRLSRIVGRDTESLGESEICRATIETLAESLCDGVIAPLSYLAVGGVPVAMAYKAVSTLDSMIGHKNDRYLYFGRVAARLDDAANYIPARMTALLIYGATLLMEPAAAWSTRATWRLDGQRHASPNAGHPESAMAGSLRVRLGGTNYYDGETIDTPVLGASFEQASAPTVHRAIGRVAAASLLGFAASLVYSLLSRHD